MTRPRRRFLLGLILAAGAAVYLPTIDHAFQYDDERKIVNNPDLRSPGNLFRAFKGGGYTEETTRLIPNLTFAFNYATFGLKTWGYHLTNLLIHLLAVWLVVRLGRKVLRLMGEKNDVVPLLAAALFALHPLNSEAVTYCNARPNTVVTVFYLAALIAFLRAFGTRAPRRWIAFALLTLGALLSKELSITLLWAIPALLLWIGVGRGERYERYSRWAWGLLAAPFVVGPILGAFTGALAGIDFILTQGAKFAGDPALFLIFTLLGQAQVFLYYLGLAIVPLPAFLNVDHGVPHLYDRLGPRAQTPATFEQVVAGPAVCLLAVLALLASCFFFRKRARFATFFVLWIFITHAPTSALPRGEAMVEYRTYLPMVGVCLAVAWGLARLPARRWIVGILLAALAVGTAVRNRAWESPTTLWTDSLHKSPGNFRIINNIGVFLEREGKLDEAMALYQEALKVQRGRPEIHYNIAVILQKQNRSPQALGHLEEALRIDPGYSDAHYLLGVIFEQQGRIPDANEKYRKAAETNHRSAEPHIKLGALAVREGRLDEAVRHYEKAARIRPDHPGARQGLGFLMMQLRRYDEAETHYRALLQIDPKSEQALIGLEMIQAARRQP